MSKVNDGGTAFPATERNAMHEMVGMTLRDYFAAKAMQSQFLEISWNKSGGVKLSEVSAISQAAYQMADAMLAARDAD